MLDGIEDPHNLGAILRSVDAFGADGVIIGVNRAAKLNATVAKVSTGAIEYVDVAMVTNLNQTIKKLKEEGFWVVSSDVAVAECYVVVRAIFFAMTGEQLPDLCRSIRPPRGRTSRPRGDCGIRRSRCKGRGIRPCRSHPSARRPLS